LIFDQLTTGAGNDLERATALVRKMICEWGMSEKLGPMTFGKKQEEIFLGREIAQHRDYSERTAQLIDDEIKRILIESEEKATKLLTDNIDHLHAVAKALLERESLDGAEIDTILRGEELAPIPVTPVEKKPEELPVAAREAEPKPKPGLDKLGDVAPGASPA
jgi:cell division protease FtsH